MWQVTHEDEVYNMQGKIGEGYTAQVFKAVSAKKKTICVKVINDDFLKHSLGKSLIQNQINMLRKLKHQHVLKFIKKQQGKKLMIVTQYCSGGTLFDYLRGKGKVQHGITSKIMRQLIEGCQYLHGQGVIHRDLKPENVFFTEQGGQEIKIADFGFAVSLKDNTLISANVGSPLYMPYESLAAKKFSIESDIFALGVIWYELLTGKTPFSASTEGQLKDMTKREQIRSLQLPGHSKIKELIVKCLKCQPNERPSLLDLLTGIEESQNGDRVKSKSFFYLSVKEQPKKKVTKGSKGQKENKDPLFSHQAVTRDRCKTFLDLKQQGKTEPLSKMFQRKPSGKLFPQSRKTGKQISMLAKQNLLDLIQKLSGIKLAFLPISVQVKFSHLLNLYKNLIIGKETPRVKGEEAKQDELIQSLSSCKTEQDFCISCFGFLRRLIRLTKTYKEFSRAFEDLSGLWDHVQAQCLVK